MSSRARALLLPLRRFDLRAIIVNDGRPGTKLSPGIGVGDDGNRPANITPLLVISASRRVISTSRRCDVRYGRGTQHQICGRPQVAPTIQFRNRVKIFLSVCR